MSEKEGLCKKIAGIYSVCNYSIGLIDNQSKPSVSFIASFSHFLSMVAKHIVNIFSSEAAASTGEQKWGKKKTFKIVFFPLLKS